MTIRGWLSECDCHSTGGCEKCRPELEPAIVQPCLRGTAAGDEVGTVWPWSTIDNGAILLRGLDKPIIACYYI